MGVEAGEGSHAPDRGSPPARDSAPPPGVGILKLKVEHRSICFDTTADGNPGPHEGATVTLQPATGATRTETSGADGIATFVDVPAGLYTATVTQTGYVSGSASGVVNADTVNEDRAEIEIDRGTTLICDRQHTPKPTGAPTVNGLSLIFWHDAFMIWVREAAWLLFLVLLILFTIIAAVNLALSLHWHPGIAGFCLPVTLFGVVAFLITIIFGEIPGIISMVLAGLAWLAMIGLTIASVAGVPGLLPLDFVWFPVVCGMWTSFFIFLIPRMNYRIEVDWPYLFLFPIPSVVVALVLYLVMVYVPEPNMIIDGGLQALAVILCIVFAFIFGLVGGLTGHCFRNDGAVDPYTANPTKRLLPFAGDRYCVQGNRGYFSHYESTGQERCYDFAVPEGSHVLAIDEGHVIEFREDKTGSAYDGSGNNTANYIYVQHRDGTIAHYLHLKQGGITAVNRVLVENSTSLDSVVYRSDIHVHAGQVLAEAGSTGISRFPHIHLGVYDRSGRSVGLEFKDADVQRHGGRCYTFRKYMSQNTDNGSITLRTP